MSAGVRQRSPLRVAHSAITALAIAALAAGALGAGACGSDGDGDGDDDNGPSESTSVGAGGATGEGGASSDGGSGGRACIGCGEQLTTSDAMAVLCDGAVPLWTDWTSCVCVACAETCGATCELPPNPGCSTCRVQVTYGACAEPWQACADDL